VITTVISPAELLSLSSLCSAVSAACLTLRSALPQPSFLFFSMASPFSFWFQFPQVYGLKRFQDVISTNLSTLTMPTN